MAYVAMNCGFTEQYIKNLAANPDQNLDHMTAYIIVFHRFKKVSPGGTVSLAEARNLFDFYKSIESEGYEVIRFLNGVCRHEQL